MFVVEAWETLAVAVAVNKSKEESGSETDEYKGMPDEFYDEVWRCISIWHFVEQLPCAFITTICLSDFYFRILMCPCILGLDDKGRNWF